MAGRMQQEITDAPHETNKYGPGGTNTDALSRMSYVEGQIRGIRKMIDEDRYCIDILTQVSAVRAALNKVGMSILRRHIEHCVSAAVRSEDPLKSREILDELMTVLEKTSL